MINYEIFEQMLPDELQSLINFLQSIIGTVSNNKNTISKIINREKGQVICPYCASDHIVKNGHNEKKIQRYKCKNCSGRFSETTNTPCSHTKLSYSTWLDFFKCMNDKLSIRKTAVKLNLNKNTIFSMRHKVLNALSIFRKNTKWSGKVQTDEKYFSINLKGLSKSKMPRASKPRKSQGGSKRGISKHQICVESAIDGNDNFFFEIVGNGPITSEMAEKSMNYLGASPQLSTGQLPHYVSEVSYPAF